MNDGLQREGREVDGRDASMGRRPPVECNEGKNEWFHEESRAIEPGVRHYLQVP